MSDRDYLPDDRRSRDALDGDDDHHLQRFLDAFDSGRVSVADDVRLQTVTDGGAFESVYDHEGREIGYDQGDSAFQSDQEHDFQLREQAQIGADGQVLDELDAATNYEAQKRAEEDEQAAFVRTNPRSAYEEAILGGEATVTAGQQDINLVRWAGVDGEARNLTISLGLVGAPGAAARPRATIAWGTRNAKFSATVDVTNGQTITLSASSVYVDVNCDVGSANVSAALGFGSRNTQAPATRTVYVDGLANGGGTTTVTIPNFAKALLPVQTDDAGGPTLRMDFKDASGVIVFTDQLLALGQQVANIPISGDLAGGTILLTNSGTAATAKFRLVFQLSL